MPFLPLAAWCGSGNCSRRAVVLVALADLLATPKRSTVGCKVAVVLAELGNEDRAVLSRALNNSAFSAAEIAAALRAEGRRVGETTIKGHRAKTCSCEDAVWENAKARP